MKLLLFNAKRLSLVVILTSMSILAFGQEYHFQYGFQGALPAGWDAENIWMGSSNTNSDWEGNYGGSNPIKIKENAVVTTPDYFTAGTLSCWLRGKNAGEANDFVIEKGIVDEQGEVTWSTIYEEPEAGVFPVDDGGSEYYKQIVVDINSTEPRVKIRFKNAEARTFYLDDVALTAASPDESNAEIVSISIDGKDISEFNGGVLEYDSISIAYPSLTFTEIATFHPDANVVTTKPVDYYGSKEERTASVEVTSPNGANTLVYKFAIVVDNIHEYVDFETPLPDNWEDDGMYNSSGEGYNSEYAPRFTRTDGYLVTDFYKGISKIEFYSKHDPGNDAFEELVIWKLVKDDQGNVVETKIIDFLTDFDIQGSYNKFEADINDNSEQVAIKFTVNYVNENTRIYVDDIQINGHDDYISTSVSEIISGSELKIYPNPVQEFINIDMPESVNGKLTIYNITGETIKSLMLDNIATNRVNVSDLSSGIYMLTIETEEKMFNRKFIVK